jgi:hypothetical protein
MTGTASPAKAAEGGEQVFAYIASLLSYQESRRSLICRREVMFSLGKMLRKCASDGQAFVDRRRDPDASRRGTKVLGASGVLAVGAVQGSWYGDPQADAGAARAAHRAAYRLPTRLRVSRPWCQPRPVRRRRPGGWVAGCCGRSSPTRGYSSRPVRRSAPSSRCLASPLP